MAQVNYQPVANVQPEARPPDDYIRAQASPQAFGGLVAQGAEQIGKGAFTLGQHWNEVRTDDVTNQALESGNKIVENFKTKYGQNALDAQDKTREDLQTAFTSARDKLTTSDQTLQFDRYVRPYFDRYFTGGINTHANEQGLQFANKTTDDSMKVANTLAAQAGSDGNEGVLGPIYNKALGAASKKLQIAGQDRDPDAIQAGKDSAASVLKSYAEALSVKNAPGALDFVQRNKNKFGTLYEPLVRSLQQNADRAAGAKANADASMQAKNWPPGAVGYNPKTGEYLMGATRNRDGSPAPPVPTEAGVRSDNAAGSANIAAREAPSGPVSVDAVSNAIHGQESGGRATSPTSVDNAHGGWQVTPKFFQTYARPGENIDNPVDNEAAARRGLADIYQKVGGDPARVAVAYFSGLGNVAPAGSPTPYLRDVKDSNGKSTSAYVSDVLTRLGRPQPATAKTMPARLGNEPQPFGQPTTPETPTSTSEAAPAAPEPEPAAFTPPPLTSQPQPVETPEDFLARKMQIIEQNPNLNDVAREHAVQLAKEEFLGAQIAAEQDARAKREQKETVLNNINGYANNGDFQGAYQALNAARQSGHVNETDYATMSEVIERRAGAPNPTSYGTAYKQTLDRILAQPNDPQRIADPAEVYRLEAKGLLAPKGADEAIRVMSNIKKSVDVYGEQRMISGLLDVGKRRLSYATPGSPLKDPTGQDIYDNQFVPAFYSQINAWRDSGQTMDKFPLFQKDKMDAFVNSLRSERDRVKAQQKELDDVLGGRALPEAPEGADTNYWSQMMTNRPLRNGAPIDAPLWANALNILVSNPTAETVQYFNNHFSAGGYKGGQILKGLLGDKYKGPVEKEPEPTGGNALPPYFGP